ncbi:hypothetical protein BLNAU_17687 [Blattamonas nauphoetae]|uniref:Uncharacterized protein n=1 Tax=Blattamonas nauphoetae TaxID=2049346 RepID=A0ABQ9X9J7_9EUKA|nr:hypothetical protein BLNAU_17687 [Blattamonas nauphoetae]
MESLFIEPEIVDSLYLQHKELIISTFNKIGNSSPPSAVFTTLAHISLFPHLRISYNSLLTLFRVVEQDPPALTLLPSPIFPSSSPPQQYSGLSFLAAQTKKLRIVFSEFQQNIPTEPSHLPKYVKLTTDDPFKVTHSLNFCSCSFSLPNLQLDATPPIEVDSEIIRELILFVKEALITILINISNIDTLIASFPSDSSPTTPSVSGVDIPKADSLHTLRKECEGFVRQGWNHFIFLANKITDPHKSSFQTILLDDPSFPDLILNSLKLPHHKIRENTILAIINIVVAFPMVKKQFMTMNLVGRMFETVDFVSLPLSESQTLFALSKFIDCMFLPIEDNDNTRFKQYPLIRSSVFEPAQQFIIFFFNNSDKLVLDEEDNALLEDCICFIHHHIKNMELRSDEHDPDFVSELVKWETRTMVEMENEVKLRIVFESVLDRTFEWNEDKRERQKRREVRLREEGWDDGFELRVVGIEVDTDQEIQDLTTDFRIELAFNADEI